MTALVRRTPEPNLRQLTAQGRTLRGRIVVCLLPLLLTALGCGTTPKMALEAHKANNGDFYRNLAKQVDYADPQLHAMQQVPHDAPFTIENNLPTEYWNLPLEEAILLSLSNSTVLRDLGGQLLRSPAAIPSIHNPQIVETDPRFGIENALSAFDTSFNTKMFYERNDRALNNAFFGGGTRLLQQDLLTAQESLTKTAATGSQFIVRHNTNYDANNAPGNLFPSAWDTNVEAEFRHPLLQGSGVEFNRIAGPTGQLGLFNGVVLARMNTDISLAEFETAVRNMVADVENGYWDLYFAYRDLQTKIVARDNALKTWRRTNALFETEGKGGEADKEAQAREQYYRFQEEVENALTGQVLEGTHTNNGSSGGSFRGTVGVQLAERRLRLVCGLPISDGRMIRPSDEPVVTKVSLDWTQTSQEALARRPELRRQRWVVKRREMELVATKNYLMPRLDATGRYRFRGFGNDLLNSDGNTNGNQFDNAYDNLLTGNFQEWQLGMDLTVPLGFRRAHSAVRNQQLLLARERALLHEQERSVLHDLSNAIGDMQRAYSVTQTSYNRLVAARDQLNAVQVTHDRGRAPLDFLLEAQRRNAEAEGRYYRALVEHATALRNVHFEKGTSLEYHNVFLNEDRQDFAGRKRPFITEKPLNYVMQKSIEHPDDGAAPPAATAVSRSADQPTLAPQQVTPPAITPASAPSPSTPNTAPTGSPIPTQISAGGERSVAASYEGPAAPRFEPQSSTTTLEHPEASALPPPQIRTSPQVAVGPTPASMNSTSSNPSGTLMGSTQLGIDTPIGGLNRTNWSPTPPPGVQPSMVQPAAAPTYTPPAAAAAPSVAAPTNIVRPSGAPTYVAPSNTVQPNTSQSNTAPPQAAASNVFLPNTVHPSAAHSGSAPRFASSPVAPTPPNVTRKTVVRLPLPQFEQSQPAQPQYPTAYPTTSGYEASAPVVPLPPTDEAPLGVLPQRQPLPSILFGRDPLYQR